MLLESTALCSCYINHLMSLRAVWMPDEMFPLHAGGCVMRRSVTGCSTPLPHAWRILSEVEPGLYCAAMNRESAEHQRISPRRGVRCGVDRLRGHNDRKKSKNPTRIFKMFQVHHVSYFDLSRRVE